MRLFSRHAGDLDTERDGIDDQRQQGYNVGDLHGVHLDSLETRSRWIPAPLAMILL